MGEFTLATFTALFVTVNPIKGAALFAVLVEGTPRAAQRRIAGRATLIATGLLVVFALFGDDLLRVIGISLAGVRVGGGILLMLLSIDIVFGYPIGPSATPGAGSQETGPDISVFPLATPIIAGPGAITAIVVQASGAENRDAIIAYSVLGVTNAEAWLPETLGAGPKISLVLKSRRSMRATRPLMPFTNSQRPS